VTGKVIGGRYRLERRLGHGGAASVWEAEDLELGRRVAVKVLARDADRERFEREARAVASLTHPNVARVFDFGESEDGPYMVLELLPGGTLDDRMRDGRPLPDDETARIAAGIAAGLSHAHELGIVHRDLKPANVLFDAEDRPRIADFGIARQSQGGTITEEGTILGTASTLAPEQAQGERATPASDVYAFGVILFLMLTGRLPFEADDPVALASLHVTEAAPSISALRPDAPPRLESLAAAALAKDPGDRPRDGAALVAELEGIAAVPAGGVTAAMPAVRRRRLSRAAAGVAIVALAVAGTLVALALADDPPAPAAETSVPKPTASAPGPTEPVATEEPPPTVAETTTPTTTTAQDTTALPTTTEAPATEPPTTTEVPPATEPPPPPPPTAVETATPP
jgi:eukaryotic-like serine/threonine-protein kinase